jgi:hypothetical protein
MGQSAACQFAGPVGGTAPAIPKPMIKPCKCHQIIHVSVRVDVTKQPRRLTRRTPCHCARPVAARHTSNPGHFEYLFQTFSDQSTTQIID